MAIIRKEKVDEYLRELDEFHQRLRKAVMGETPSANVAHRYGPAPDKFETEYRDVHMASVKKAMKHYKAEVDYLACMKDDFIPMKSTK